LAKTVDVSEMTLDEAKAIIEAKTPKKKATKRKPAAKKK
jgi:DNA topoisomerase-1